MRRLTPYILIVSLFALTASAADLRGVWRAKVDGERVHLDLMQDGSRHGHSFSRADLQGVTDAQINSAAEAAVSLTLARDAGTIAMTGTFEAGEGVGRFKFMPNRSYGDTLRALGVPIDEELSDEHLFSLAILDISTAFIREMKSLGYSESLGQYTAFRIHGVSSDFVRELRDLGYTAVPSEQLVAMRIHGVTPRFIRELKEAGYQNVPVEKLIEMRIHGIDAEFLRKAK